jgi:hypothetical protein
MYVCHPICARRLHKDVRKIEGMWEKLESSARYVPSQSESLSELASPLYVPLMLIDTVSSI